MFGLLVFLEITYSDNLQKCSRVTTSSNNILTSSRGKTHKNILGKLAELCPKFVFLPFSQNGKNKIEIESIKKFRDPNLD